MEIEEIKFRGKSATTGRWFHGSLVVSKGKPYIHPTGEKHEVVGICSSKLFLVEVDPETVSKWTGVKDNQDNEIYPHDIINYGLLAYNDDKALGEHPFCLFDNNDPKVKDMVWNTISTVLEEAYYIYPHPDNVQKVVKWADWNPDCEGVQIIGNKFDNPELYNK